MWRLRCRLTMDPSNDCDPCSCDIADGVRYAQVTALLHQPAKLVISKTRHPRLFLFKWNHYIKKGGAPGQGNEGHQFLYTIFSPPRGSQWASRCYNPSNLFLLLLLISPLLVATVKVVYRPILIKLLHDCWAGNWRNNVWISTGFGMDILLYMSSVSSKKILHNYVALVEPVWLLQT